jgi:hypothetical protein
MSTCKGVHLIYAIPEHPRTKCSFCGCMMKNRHAYKLKTNNTTIFDETIFCLNYFCFKYYYCAAMDKPVVNPFTLLTIHHYNEDGDCHIEMQRTRQIEYTCDIDSAHKFQYF